MKYIVILFLFYSTLGFSQTDSLNVKYSKINWTEFNLKTEQQPIWKKSILPLTFTIASLSINKESTKQNIQGQVLSQFNGYKTTLDDYIQFAPIGMMYLADLFKIRAEHSIWNQTKLLFISQALTGAIVLTLKHTLKIERPDGSAFTSYPSGHTSLAFVSSQSLYHEFRHTNKLLAYSGYLFSISTGGLRVINNRHWVPDILLGAGIGILITNLVYHFEPLKNWKPKLFNSNNDVSLQFTPAISDQYVGANLKFNL